MPLPTIESIKTTIEKKHDTNIHDNNLYYDRYKNSIYYFLNSKTP